MRLKGHAASSAVSALASTRVWLLFGGVLVLSESVLIATTLFAAAGISFVASLLIAAKLYRVRNPRPADADAGPATGDAAALAPVGSRPAAAKAVAAGT
jgi:hypothetical protein